MTLKNLNIGEAPNDGAGDDLRTAFGKINDNTAMTVFSDPTTIPGAVQIGNQVAMTQAGYDALAEPPADVLIYIIEE